MSGSLDGKVAIVTGASSGIGRGCALALAKAGASVVINDIDAVGLQQTRDEIESSAGKAETVVGDVSSAADVETLVSSAERAFGGVDVLHANAGVERYVPLEQMAEEDMDRLLDVDLKGVLLCCQYVIPAMRRRGGGSIVITSSVQATTSLPGCVVYAAAKAGVVAAARTLAIEVGVDGIRVNTVSPGTIDTPMLTRDLDDMEVEKADDFLQNVREANALRRIGSVEEIGATVVFLASDSASYITATDLVVDGGFTAVKKF